MPDNANINWLREVATHLELAGKFDLDPHNVARLYQTADYLDALSAENAKLRAIETAAHDMLYDMDNANGSDEWSTFELRAALAKVTPPAPSV
jgi:hypothetical protein